MVGSGPASRLGAVAIVILQPAPPVLPSPTEPGRGGTVFAVILAVGAGLYAAAEISATVPFAATPLAVGVIVVVAAMLGSRRRRVATGLVLSGWGSAVLLVDHRVVSGDRMTPTYVLGIGVGLLSVAALAPMDERGAWLTSAAIVAFTGPLAFYMAYDIAWFGRWPIWAAVLVGWGAWDVLSVRRHPMLRARQTRGARPQPTEANR